MSKVKNRLKGILYLSIGMISLVHGVYYTSFARMYDMGTDFFVWTIPAFVLTGITWYFAAKFFRVFKRKDKNSD